MSGWDFDDLHQIVQRNLQANAKAAITCGCENRDGSWRLCMYHDGMQCAAELLTLDIEERDGLILGLAKTADRSHLSVDETELFDRIVGR